MTEDLVFLLEAMGASTGVDLDALLATREIVARRLPEEPLCGHSPEAGRPKGFTYAAARMESAWRAMFDRGNGRSWPGKFGSDWRIYLDPHMIPVLAGRRVALVDDVASSGRTLAAVARLMDRAGVRPVAAGFAMLQGEGWRGALAFGIGVVPGEWLGACRMGPSQTCAGAQTPWGARSQQRCRHDLAVLSMEPAAGHRVLGARKSISARVRAGRNWVAG